MCDCCVLVQGFLLNNKEMTSNAATSSSLFTQTMVDRQTSHIVARGQKKINY